MRDLIDLELLKKNFLKHSGTFTVEDNVKVKFASEIMIPLLNAISPEETSIFLSEHPYLCGGRADATFKNIVFEYKKKNYLDTQKGIREALYGRDEKDHGLESYLVSHSGIVDDDVTEMPILSIR